MMEQDHYILNSRFVKEPPQGFFQKLKFLGPGFILSASIVGSGELIATTTLGAEAGYIMFWIIIVSCLVKVAVQVEFGRQAIYTGMTPIQSFNTIPAFRARKRNWAILTVFGLMIMKIVQLGGILGGAAITLNMLSGSIPVFAWAIFIAGFTSLLIFRGYYSIVERSSLVMIALFTLMAIASLVSLNYTSYRFSFNDIISGLNFTLPPELVGLAFGAFGITGVGADEIIAYNYWCLEKGYAAYTGPRTDDSIWHKRAKGWIRVMYLDAIVAMIIYTLVTAAFYVLGAAILHSRNAVPAGNELIETIALIFTQSLGPGFRTAFLIGAFVVLFSSVFATLAAWTRLFSDIFGHMGWIRFSHEAERKKTISFLAWIIPVFWLLAFLFINLPVLMVLSGGVVGSFLLLLVAFAAAYFFMKREKELSEVKVYGFLFFLSVISILVVAIYGLFKLFI